MITILVKSVKFDNEMDGEFYDIEDEEARWKEKIVTLDCEKEDVIEQLLNYISDASGWCVNEVDYKVV